MRCRICGHGEVPSTWHTVAWCDPCLTRGLELARERPGLTLPEAVDVIRAERGDDGGTT